jgi:hypothetical protein
MAIRGSNSVGKSGLDILMAFRQDRPVRLEPRAPDEQAWRKWAASDPLELWQLVALHSSVDPDSLGSSPELAIRAMRYSKLRDAIQMLLRRPIDDRPIHRLQRNFEQALAALRDGDLRPTISGAQPSARAWIPLDAFCAWATRAGLGVAGAWSPRDQDVAFPYCASGLAMASRVARDLAGRYLHDDVSRAPSISETVRYAIDCYNVSENMAKAIARLIRPDHLPRGRRRKRREGGAPR